MLLEQRILFLVQVRSITIKMDRNIVCLLCVFLSIFVLPQWTNGFTMRSEKRVPARSLLPSGHNISLPIWWLSFLNCLHKCLDVISSFTKQCNKRQQVLKLCVAFILLPLITSLVVIAWIKQNQSRLEVVLS